MVLRLTGKHRRHQAQGSLGPSGGLVVIELIPGDRLHQPVEPQSALRRDGDQTGAGQGTGGLGLFQPITQRRSQDRARLRRFGGQELQVDVVGVQERAQL